VSDH